MTYSLPARISSETPSESRSARPTEAISFKRSDVLKIREPFNTSVPAQVAALAALEDVKHLERTRAVNLEGRDYLYKELDALGVEYAPTETNFIFMVLKDVEAGAAYEAMLEDGVIVRPMGANMLRVTIGLADENRRFVEAFKKVIKG